MKNYIILFIALVALPGSIRAEFRQENKPPAARQMIRHAGSANLSNGIYLPAAQEVPAAESLIRFFQEQGVTVNRATPARKNVTVEMTQVETVAHAPVGSIDAYLIRITPARITIESRSPRGLSIAVQALKALYLQERATQRGRKMLLPCYEIRGWNLPGEMTPFRLENNPFHTAADLTQNIETLLPAHAHPVEWMLTDPDRGWLIPGETLQEVGYTGTIHSGDFYTYAELRELSDWMDDYGVEMIPTFDLITPNARFEEVTGHPMLSVEGLRFVRHLLEEFFQQSDLKSANFIVPEGKYRTQLEEITSGFNSITSVHFLDK